MSELEKLADEKTVESVVEVSKSQTIRLVDIFVLAPIMIYAGTFKALPLWVRYSLVGMGLATAAYNAKNYIANKKTLNKSKN
jgi:hypothetical protein